VISLIGKTGFDPRPTLERWNYLNNVGNHTSAPLGGDVGSANWRFYKATVQGVFIQLSNEFSPVGVLDNPNYRYCNQTTYYPGREILYTDIAEAKTFNAANYTCRTKPGSTWDLLGYNLNEDKVFESRYGVGSGTYERPPDDLLGLKQNIVYELPLTALDACGNNLSWAVHNPMFQYPGSCTPPP
jgi:hypothetical protein